MSVSLDRRLAALAEAVRRRGRTARPRGGRARAACDREGGSAAGTRCRVDGRRARRPHGRRQVAALQHPERNRARRRRAAQADHVDGAGGGLGRRCGRPARLARDQEASSPGRGRTEGPGASRPARLRLRRGRAPARGGQDRRARRSPRLGRRAAEVRRRRASRRLPPTARRPRRVDGRRPQPGRPPPAGGDRRVATRHRSPAHAGRAGRDRPSLSSRRGRVPASTSSVGF